MKKTIRKYLLIFLIILLIYSLIEYRSIKTKEIHSKDFDESNPLLNKKIVFLSDFQYDRYGFFNHSMMKKIVKKVNDLNPDYVVLGGDYIYKKQKQKQPVFDYLSQINAPKIGVLGNHDYYDLDTVLEGAKQANITLLVNDTLTLDGITFVGLDDLRRGNPQLPEVIGDYTVLLTHDPDTFEYTSRKQTFNLALAGHLHGGQITFFGKYAPILPTAYGQKYRYGFAQANNQKVYVTSGLGGYVFVLPIRFFAQPEIVVINI